VNKQVLKFDDLEHTSGYWLKAVGSITLTFTFLHFSLGNVSVQLFNKDDAL